MALAATGMAGLRLKLDSCGLKRTQIAAPLRLRAQPLRVSMMAKRTIELKEIRGMSDELINETVVDLKGELFLMRCKKVTRQDYRVSDYKNMKKKIARMLTVKREREIERGIKPRESRKLKAKWKRSIVYRPPPSLAAILDAQKTEEDKA
ncbi:50S ribosomal protein L29, chloroplastic isoform X2 [Selaginella moellendorffii]|uniref:50S ribosomal protein L29, chloroplastic isoform X2 n=1 Tax=Selaginella moellendorffii TaxID=88036 RepID=UPI000D1CB0E4|nr:50S ribosomal protein L29, chloroplastic isoform X2 [Selaginella moellendorffii]|eukprot:XP_002966464.2 50S ribosomal protein L29, chloroplastic isoform X2 [Selaginella moellendorffii]